MDNDDVVIVENALKNLTELYVSGREYPMYVDFFDEQLVINCEQELFGMMKMLGILLDVDAIDLMSDGVEISVELI